MIKPISLALALSLAAASAAALADDTTTSMSATHMQTCVSKEKAKNDGRSDADINQACTAKIQRHHSQSNGGMNPSNNGPAPSSTTTSPGPATSPTTTTPDDTPRSPQ